MESTPNSLNPPTGVDHAFDRAEEVVASLQNAFRRIYEALHLRQLVDTGKQFANDHPIISVLVGVTMVMCFLPFMCFCVFALGSTILVFTGFMFVEGLLLTCGIAVLIGILFFMVCLSIVCSVMIIIAYYILLYARQIATQLRNKINIPENVGFHSD